MMPPDRLTPPAPGAHALRLRLLIEELNEKLVFHARHGISDWRLIDEAAAEFLLSLVDFDIAANPVTKWPWVLGAQMNLLSATREAALECPVEQDGEEWKRA